MVDDSRALSFGAYAAEYHRARPGYPDAAVDWVLPDGARRVLDLGAGTGRLTASLVARGLDVVAVEPDPAMLAVLRAGLPGVAAHEGFADRVPLPDASVDAVVVGQAWHWFPVQRAVAEVRRVLVPGGRLGLLWNARRAEPGWAAEVAALGQDHVPATPPGAPAVRPTRDVPDGLPPDEAEGLEVDWDWEVAPQHVPDNLATSSGVAALPADERGALLGEALRLAAGEARRAGRATVAWPWCTLAVRWTPR